MASRHQNIAEAAAVDLVGPFQFSGGMLRAAWQSTPDLTKVWEIFTKKVRLLLCSSVLLNVISNRHWKVFLCSLEI